MKQYFKRLKNHPGIFWAIIFTIAGVVAALGNHNIHNKVTAIIIGLAFSSLWWIIILTTNGKN